MGQRPSTSRDRSVPCSFWCEGTWVGSSPSFARSSLWKASERFFGNERGVRWKRITKCVARRGRADRDGLFPLRLASSAPPPSASQARHLPRPKSRGRSQKESLPWFLRGRWAEGTAPEGVLRTAINRSPFTYPLILIGQIRINLATQRSAVVRAARSGGGVRPDRRRP